MHARDQKQCEYKHVLILRGTILIVIRTYGIHKNLYIYPFFLTNILSYLPWSPVVVFYTRACSASGEPWERSVFLCGMWCAHASSAPTFLLVCTSFGTPGAAV